MARLARGEQTQILMEGYLDELHGDEPTGHQLGPEAQRIISNSLPAGGIALSDSIEDVDIHPQAYTAEYTDAGTFITVT
jgi:hypothetical protein